MINKLADLKRELLWYISALPEDHSYNILFFGDGGKVLALDRWQMVAPTLENRDRAAVFLNGVLPTGTTNPLPSIEHALKFRPDVIYFFSDGEFNNLTSYAKVIKTFAEGNSDRRITVNTYLFDTLDAEAVETMKRIAADSGGTFRSADSGGIRFP